MRKYELNGFPRLAIIMTILGLFLAVVAMSVSLIVPDSGNAGGLAIFEIVGAVLVLAGLTTGKVLLLRVINIILTVGILITSFVLAIVKFSDQDVFLFAISLLMLVASILGLIYFLTMKNERITKMFFYAATIFFALALIYGIVYVVEDVLSYNDYGTPIHFGNYFLIFGFAVVSFLPMANHRSLTVIETPDEPQEEEKPQEKEENN